MVAHRRRTAVGKYLPVGYMAVAVSLAAFLLPSALRPPQDQQSTTAAFSPDAPPDDAPPETLLQSMRAASSATAGGQPTEVIEIEDEIVIEQETPPPAPPRGRCFGDDPPRQTESLYSHRCVPAWGGGDNGGRTAPGVYEDEVRLGIVVGSSSRTPEGRLDREFDSDDFSEEHDLKVWQTYFNERFEFHGRYLQFYVVKQSSQDEDQQRASVRKAKEEYGAFAMIGDGYGQGAAAMQETFRQKMIDFGSIGPDCSFYAQNHPYAYSFVTDGCQMHEMLSELSCQQFGLDPPGALNERQDALFDYDAPRKWGVIAYQDESRYGAIEQYREYLERCGIELTLGLEYNLTDNQQAIAGLMAKMRQEGVTTIILYVDVYTPIAMTREAQRIEYFPEYVQIGLGSNSAARLLESNQARHMVGITAGELPRQDEDKDWYRAYKEIDPEGDPDSGYFRSLQQLSGGIQWAGPHLTVESFWQGLKTQPHRVPDPVWSIGGGYDDGDYTYMDYFAMQWWDPDGDDPESSRSGAWCHVLGGQRYMVGEVPGEPFPWHDKDQCIYGPAKGVQG